MLTVELVDNTAITFMETITNNPQPLCQSESERRDAANRADMLIFQKRARRRMRTVGDELERFLWFGTLKWHHDGRKNGMPNYVGGLLKGLVGIFAVKNSAEAPRLRFPERFEGEWRRLPRKELASLYQDYLRSVSEYQMTRFLRLLEDWGMITRYNGSAPDSHTSLLILRFNPRRLVEILEVELPRARKERYRKTPIPEVAPAPGSDQVGVALQPSAGSVPSSSSMDSATPAKDRECAATLHVSGEALPSTVEESTCDLHLVAQQDGIVSKI